jgi:ribonuclease P/MRP protein subunit POP5
MKLKPILPSLKEKKRYVVFEIISKSRIKAFSAISKAIYASSLSFAGDHGVARMGLQVLPEKFDADEQKGMLRVSADMLDELKASLALIEDIEGEPCAIQSIGVSGILNKAEKKFMAG